MSSAQPTWGPWRSLLALLPVLVIVPVFSMHKHYALPTPVVDLVDVRTSLPQLSEARILAHAQHLSEDIGYRTVGTREHALGDAWMLQQAQRIQRQCEDVVGVQSGRKLECEVWRQEGNGSHRFDMMGKRLYKTYRSLSNIVVRISDGTAAGKEHAVLVNAHLDSTLPSPGAADDALSVGVMLDCMRVLVGTPGWEPTHSIIFLFNNAEESLQDGSHLFSTQHPIAPTVRAFINLEAAGNTGPELLFQATSEEMIQAYAHVPWPHGTVVANDVFSSGIIMSDTDFRQFELYLNVTGLDMAVVGNSYFYHMRKDLVEYIQPGVAQHMAENTLALLRELSSAESALPTLTSGYSRPTTAFFSLMGSIVTYSFRTALTLHALLLTSSIVFVLWSSPVQTAHGSSVGTELLVGAASFAIAFAGALFGVNVVALIMQHLLGKGMSWFASELSSIALYGPAALAGALSSHLLIRSISHISEQALLTSLLLSQSALAFGIQLCGIGSAGMYFLSGLPLLLALSVNSFITTGKGRVSLVTYALGQVMPLLIGTEFVATSFDVFVPLTGRMGAEAPAEHIIASLVAISCSYALPLAIPFAHRFGHRILVRSVLFFSALTGLLMIAFSLRDPFDTMHQKRLFILHSENITSSERYLHIAAGDGAPGFPVLVDAIAKEFGQKGGRPVPVVMDDWNSDWDSLYPFSGFLAPYKIGLPIDVNYASLWAAEHRLQVTAINDTIDEIAGTRSLSLVIDHPGLIWTVIAFDAHVLAWSLDDDPPNELARHHIKEASFYGVETWSVDLVIKVPPPPPDQDAANGGLRVNIVGIQEKGMWPAKKAEKDGGGPAMVLFEKLDTWLEEKYEGTVDALLLGTVGGVFNF